MRGFGKVRWYHRDQRKGSHQVSSTRAILAGLATCRLKSEPVSCSLPKNCIVCVTPLSVSHHGVSHAGNPATQPKPDENATLMHVKNTQEVETGENKDSDAVEEASRCSVVAPSQQVPSHVTTNVPKTSTGFSFFLSPLNNNNNKKH